ncbi:MAG: hypothetical protein MK132_15850 [Lentisphaerales bacterium]|nr:hypothetical protein [Lentisphaerales bacterium]
MYRLILLLCVALLTSCSSSVDEATMEKASEFQKEGTSIIGGQVLLFQEKNKILFGSNTEVLLVPVCDFSTKIISQVYGNTEKGNYPLEDHPRFDWEDLAKYNKLMNTDERGSFTFRRIPEGNYYLLSFISLPNDEKDIDEGASIMRRVSVEKGKIKMVSLRL